MTLNLNRMSSYWNRDERIKINNNWDKIEKSFNGVTQEFDNAVDEVTQEFDDVVREITQRFDNAVDEVTKKAYDEIIDAVRDLTKINWLAPVPTYNDIETTYPNPTLGDITITSDDGSVYRYDGEQWVFINKIDPDVYMQLQQELMSHSADIADVQNKIGILSRKRVNVESFPRLEGETDDTGRIMRAYEALTPGDTLILPGDYYITNLVFDKDDIFIECLGTLIQKADATGVAVTIGKSSPSFRVEGNLKVRKANRDWSQDNTGVKILNMNEADLTVDIAYFTTNLELEGNGEGCAYNSIYIKRLHNGKFNLKFTVNNDGWVNENKFFGGRFSWDSGITDSDRYHIYIPITTMNNNVFFSPSLESVDGGTLIYCNGSYNHFYSPRLEADPTTIKVKFDTQSIYNQLIYPYAHTDIFNDATYIDLGTRNHIFGRDTIQLPHTQIRPHNIKIRGSLNGNANWGITGLVDVQSTNMNLEKLWSGKNTAGTETSYIDGNGNAGFNVLTADGGAMIRNKNGNSQEALKVNDSTGTNLIFGVRGSGEITGKTKLYNSYANHWLIPWAVISTPPTSSIPDVGVAVLCTADNKLYIHFGGGVWKSVTLT